MSADNPLQSDVPISILRILALVGVLACSYELHHVYHPAYTDGQILASRVDTLDVSAYWRVLIFIAMAVIALTAVIIAIIRKHPRVRVAAFATIMVAGCAALLANVNHRTLADRASVLQNHRSVLSVEAQ